MGGYMEVTGDPKGPPTLDRHAGDRSQGRRRVYANVMLALLERSETGRGKDIDVSMLQAAASWLITVLPLIDFDCEPSEITRAGNEHRKFIPTNVYPAQRRLRLSGDRQRRAVAPLHSGAEIRVDRQRSARRPTRAGMRERDAIHRDIGAVTVSAWRTKSWPTCARRPSRRPESIDIRQSQRAAALREAN